jgi:uncharacterized protein YaaQ
VLRGSPQPGFYRMRGMATLMIGSKDEKVDQAIQIVEDQCTPQVTLTNILQRYFSGMIITSYESNRA